MAAIGKADPANVSVGKGVAGGYMFVAPAGTALPEDNKTELDAKFGPMPALKSGLRVGGVSKTLTNEYWRSLGEGYQKYADKAGVSVVYQAAQSEGDQLGQLTIAEGLITQGYDVLLVSPQTDANLQPMMEQAKAEYQRQKGGQA